MSYCGGRSEKQKGRQPTAVISTVAFPADHGAILVALVAPVVYEEDRYFYTHTRLNFLR